MSTTVHNHKPAFNVILHDDCPRCEQHVTNGGLSLDQENFGALWQRMLNVEAPPYAPRETEEPIQRYETKAESRLGSHFYKLALTLERYTALGYAAWWVASPSLVYALSFAHAYRHDYDGFGKAMKIVTNDVAEEAHDEGD